MTSWSFAVSAYCWNLVTLPSLTSQTWQKLNEATGGIVCLTRENLDERWLPSEAGALSTKVTDRVWTFLLDVNPEEVAPPLSEFLHTKAERNDVLKMVRSIHKIAVAAKERPIADVDLDDVDSFTDAHFGPDALAPGELRDAGVPTGPRYLSSHARVSLTYSVLGGM
jgi:hypothetical protein